MAKKEAAPAAKSPKVEAVRELYDRKTRLDVHGLPPGVKPRWVRNDNVERRKAMGYEIVTDADVKTNTGGREGAKHATHDMVLMATRKDRADAYLKHCAEKSRARVQRDIEQAREGLERDSGNRGRRALFFGGTSYE